MEIDDLVTQTLNQISGALLEKSRFGRSGKSLFWVSQKGLKKTATALKESCGLDSLENLSAMQVDESLVFTYFLRNTQTGATAMLRVSSEMKKPDDALMFPSIGETWEMADRFEEEIGILFGVSFDGRVAEETSRGVWDGFPLRKTSLIAGGITP